MNIKHLSALLFVVFGICLLFLDHRTHQFARISVVFGIGLFFFPSKQVINAYTIQKIKYGQLQEDVFEHKVSLIQGVLLINEYWVFPFFLIVYLCYVGIKQTELFNLHFTWFYLATPESLLLFITLCSGLLLSLMNQRIHAFYQESAGSPYVGWCYLLFCILLSFVSTLIVGVNSETIGLIGDVMSILTGTVVLLVGLLLFNK